MLRTVHLHGSLKDLAGTETIELDVDTPLSLMTALRSQVKGFRQWSSDNELGIVLTDGNGEPMSVKTEDFNLSLGKATDVFLVPKTEGSGIEYQAIATWLASYGVTATAVAVVVFVAVNLAIAYAIGAIAASLAPSPDTSDGGGREAERPSFLYNGPVNVVEQGYAVPIVYGTHMTGSIVISAGVSVEDIPYVPPEPDVVSPPAEDWQWDTSTGGDGSGGGSGGY